MRANVGEQRNTEQVKKRNILRIMRKLKQKESNWSKQATEQGNRNKQGM